MSVLFSLDSSKSNYNLELAVGIILRTVRSSEIVDNMVESSSALQNWNVLTNKANEYFGYIGEHKLSETMDWVL